MRWFVVGLMACGGGDGVSDTGGGTTPGGTDTGPFVGTLSLSFKMSEALIETLGTGETAVGPFYGAVYRDADVTSFGPIEGAEAIADVATDLDLMPSGGPVGPLFTTSDLPAEIVVVLGFIDTDGNSDGSEPDPGDPVTLPGDNKFQVVADTETPATVQFNLLNP